MPTRTGLFAALTATGLLLSACGGSPPATKAEPSPSTAATDAGTPAQQLAGLVATSADNHYVATYNYTPAGAAKRPISVTLATDGSWRVDVPGAGLGGGKDVSVAGTRNGTFQCRLGTAASCVKVAGVNGSVPAKFDPRVERLFVKWLPSLSNQGAALSVDTAPRPAGVTGHCFSVEPTAASLSSPVPSGVYCLADDGSVTGATLGMGRLVRTGNPGPGPASVTLAGPVAGSGAVPTTSPSPSPSPSTSASTSPSPRS